MLRITCGSCGKSYQVADEFAGRSTRCPGCGAAITIPGTAPMASTPSGAPGAVPPPPMSVVAPPPPVTPGAPSIAQQTSGLAIAALILGLIPGCITSILGIALGLTALRQIDREPHRYTGRGLATAGIVLGVCTMVLSLMLLMAGILLPALGAARRTARRLENDSRLAGVCKGLGTYGSTNKDYYPGFDRNGTAGPRGASPLITDRYRILLVNQYVTPEFIISPLEHDSSKAVYTGAIPQNVVDVASTIPDFSEHHYSYAMLSVGPIPTPRKGEWAFTSNSLAPVVSDRALNDDATANRGRAASIHDAAQWRGSVGWNDAHAGFENQCGGFTTKYGRTVNPGRLTPDGNGMDNLFVAENPAGDDALLYGNGDTKQ